MYGVIVTMSRETAARLMQKFLDDPEGLRGRFAEAGIGLLDLLPVELEYTKTAPVAEGYYFMRHLTEGRESVVFISGADDELRVHAQIHGTGQKPGDDTGASLSLYGQDVEWAGPIPGSIKSSS